MVQHVPLFGKQWGKLHYDGDIIILVFGFYIYAHTVPHCIRIQCSHEVYSWCGVRVEECIIIPMAPCTHGEMLRVYASNLCLIPMFTHTRTHTHTDSHWFTMLNERCHFTSRGDVFSVRFLVTSNRMIIERKGTANGFSTYNNQSLSSAGTCGWSVHISPPHVNRLC